MGTPLPDNEPASGCGLCFGALGVLGGVQPRYVTVNFSGVRPGTAFEDGLIIPHGNFRLQHVSVCLYRLVVSGAFAVRLDWAATRTRVTFSQTAVPEVTWNSLIGALCSTTLGEESSPPANGVLFGGVIRISWSQEGL